MPLKRNARAWAKRYPPHELPVRSIKRIYVEFSERLLHEFLRSGYLCDYTCILYSQRGAILSKISFKMLETFFDQILIFKLILVIQFNFSDISWLTASLDNFKMFDICRRVKLTRNLWVIDFLLIAVLKIQFKSLSTKDTRFP